MKGIEDHIEGYKRLRLNEVVDYEKFNAYAITAHSTQIEGSTLTLEETSLLIDEGITPKGKPLEHSLMVKDHHEALQMTLEQAKTLKRINPLLVRQINAKVMASTGKVYNTALGETDSSKGEYRKGAVFVQQRYFPDYQKVPAFMNQMCESVNEKMNQPLSTKEQLYLSFNVHYNFVSIHPFYDGNGRTGRLLMNLVQRKYDLPLAIVHKEDKLEYFKALEDSRGRKIIDPFNEFMEDQYKKHLSSEIELYQSQVKRTDRGMTFF